MEIYFGILEYLRICIQLIHGFIKSIILESLKKILVNFLGVLSGMFCSCFIWGSIQKSDFHEGYQKKVQERPQKEILEGSQKDAMNESQKKLFGNSRMNFYENLRKISRDIENISIPLEGIPGKSEKNFKGLAWGSDCVVFCGIFFFRNCSLISNMKLATLERLLK